MDLLLVVVVVFAVAAVVSAPLRRAPRAEDEQDGGARAELAELEAQKEAKYREIRDAELDRRTGKLSQEDWQALDRGLRAEAVALLRRLDAAKASAHRRDAVG